MFTIIEPLLRTQQEQASLHELLDNLSTQYNEDVKYLAALNSYWCYARHPQHGIIGGVCLTPPNSVPIFSHKNKALSKINERLKNGWLASHLFFYLPEEIMDEMTNDELEKIMSAFYTDLFRALTTFSKSRAIPHFWLIAPSDQHMGAVAFGHLPFAKEMPFMAEEAEYVASLLNMDKSTQKLFDQSKLFSSSSFSQRLSLIN